MEKNVRKEKGNEKWQDFFCTTLTDSLCNVILYEYRKNTRLPIYYLPSYIYGKSLVKPKMYRVMTKNNNLPSSPVKNLNMGLCVKCEQKFYDNIVCILWKEEKREI